MKFEIISCTNTHISRINISKLLNTTPTKQRNNSKSLERSLSRSSSLNRQNFERILTTTTNKKFNINNNNNNNNNNNRMLSPNTNNKVKRNLFGQLNHDLLKNDLNEMWKETIEQQKVKWNFDFETLCPLSNKSSTDKLSNNNNNNNYEWTIVDESIPEFYKKGYKSHKISSSSLNSSLASSTHDENNDSLTEPIFKMRLRTKTISSPNKKLNNNKPKRVNNKKKSTTTTTTTNTKQRTLALTTQANLIITYSENRKDTLRSSTKAKSTPSSNTNEFKQQTLLDMFQQRKRRNFESNEKNKNFIHQQQQNINDSQSKIRKYFQSTTVTTSSI